MTERLAPRNTAETCSWERGQRLAGARYPGQCLILQRSARGIPSLAPTAFAASLLVPDDEKVHKISKYRRGMVGFSKGSNPAGHIFLILGHKKGFDPEDPDGVVTSSNDVIESRPGAIGIVPLSFYHNVWNHDLQFAATWLNGYDFADFNAPPKAVHPTLGANYEAAIKLVSKAVRAHAKDKDQALHDMLVRDLAHMKKRYKNHAA